MFEHSIFLVDAYASLVAEQGLCLFHSLFNSTLSGSLVFIDELVDTRRPTDLSFREFRSQVSVAANLVVHEGRFREESQQHLQAW